MKTAKPNPTSPPSSFICLSLNLISGTSQCQDALLRYTSMHFVQLLIQFPFLGVACLREAYPVFMAFFVSRIVISWGHAFCEVRTASMAASAMSSGRRHLSGMKPRPAIMSARTIKESEQHLTA